MGFRFDSPKKPGKRAAGRAVELPTGTSWALSPAISAADDERLRKAGFAPVVRWVDAANRDDKPLKTIEALTLLDRREAAARKKGP